MSSFKCSSVITEMRLPTSSVLVPSCLHGDVCLREVLIFGAVLEFAAVLAADPAWERVVSTCESAKISGMLLLCCFYYYWKTSGKLHVTFQRVMIY